MQVKKQQLQMDMEHRLFQIGKGVRQGYTLWPYLFHLYAEYIMRNARLEEAQAGIKIAWEISITLGIQLAPPLSLMSESKELKSLLI